MSGAIFSYVYTKNDAPDKADPEDIAQNALKGHIIISNGPFIKADVNGSLPGDEVNGKKASSLELHIEVLAAKQANIDRVQVLVNGRQDKKINFTRATHPQLFTSNNLQFKHSLPLLLEKDAHVIVVATREKNQEQASAKKTEITSHLLLLIPFLLIWMANGFDPNKDLLGTTLTISKKGDKKQVSSVED